MAREKKQLPFERVADSPVNIPVNSMIGIRKVDAFHWRAAVKIALKIDVSHRVGERWPNQAKTCDFTEVTLGKKR
jgi:hypothetical protein